jgi:hypothetical protein
MQISKTAGLQQEIRSSIGCDDIFLILGQGMTLEVLLPFFHFASGVDCIF